MNLKIFIAIRLIRLIREPILFIVILGNFWLTLSFVVVVSCWQLLTEQHKSLQSYEKFLTFANISVLFCQLCAFFYHFWQFLPNWRTVILFFVHPKSSFRSVELPILWKFHPQCISSHKYLHNSILFVPLYRFSGIRFSAEII